MKAKLLSLLVSIVISVIANAQILSFKATTGDLEMDNLLTNIHNQAIKDLSNFKANLSASFSIGLPKIEASLKLLPPGDIFMAAQLASSINKPFEEVVRTYSANKSKGWGAMAKEMGIKPGSPEFHAMKKSMKSKGNGPGGGYGGAEKGKGNGGGKGKGKGGKK